MPGMMQSVMPGMMAPHMSHAPMQPTGPVIIKSIFCDFKPLTICILFLT